MKKLFFPAIIATCLVLSGCQQKLIDNKPDLSGQQLKLVDNKLDLSGRQLKKVPDYVFKLTNLEELDISNNQITGALQAEIRNLKNLKVLNANSNLMTGIPAEIGRLSNLQILDFSNNQLTGLPYEIGNLKKIQTLNISRNKYSSSDLDIISKSLPASTNIIK